MHDLVIRGGTLVDGTGEPARDADVAVEAGRIAAVGRGLGPAREEIDARAKLVTPGFVDVHTHYDGQATWDALLSPSCWHGVTTLVMGNCGVGFAPVRPGQQDFLIGLMEGVEDIPGTALHEGIRWSWEAFPEFLDALVREGHVGSVVEAALRFPLSSPAVSTVLVGYSTLDHLEYAAACMAKGPLPPAALQRLAEIWKGWAGGNA